MGREVVKVYKDYRISGITGRDRRQAGTGCAVASRDEVIE
jgi:hypothetical protein